MSDPHIIEPSQQVIVADGADDALLGGHTEPINGIHRSQMHLNLAPSLTLDHKITES